MTQPLLIRSLMTGVERPRPQIAIVGGGFSGALLAVHLLSSRIPLRISLYERRSTFARGVAYSTDRLEHLLNVPAGNMSALVGQPMHFLEWLQQYDPSATVHTFAPRTLYGHYLEEVLMTARHEAWVEGGGVTTLERIQDDVVDIRPLEGAAGQLLRTRLGGERFADAVVLATGHQSPSDPLPKGHGLKESARYVRDPWKPLHLPSPDAPVLLVGTGLTTVDVLLTLKARGHRGPVWALSRHGLLPQAHVAGLIGVSVPPEETRPQRLSELLRMVRRQLAQETNGSGQAGIPDPARWRAVIDGLRPHLSEFWQRLNPAEQKRFMRHLRAYWDMGRHRVAPSIGVMLDEMQRTGQLRVAAGRIVSVEETAAGVTVSWRPRHSDRLETTSVAKIINCTGPDTNLTHSTDPLLQRLFAQGLVVGDALGLGLETASSGALIDANGQASSRLFAIGPLLRPRLWESIAVPELRVQALALASRLVGTLKPHSFLREGAEPSASTVSQAVSA